MAVPLPVDLVMGSIPQGFKGDLQEYANVIIENVTATVDPTFLVVKGQSGGNTPTTDIGPWLNGQEWWFWDPTLGYYVPSTQGTPVGTIIMWGGQGVPANGNWLLCDGRQISRNAYYRLFQAIGTTWGVGDGATTFNLPPSACFFISAPGFAADAEVTITSGYTNQGVNSRGGSQTTTLESSDLPAMQVSIPELRPAFGKPTSGYQVSNLQGEGAAADAVLTYRVRDTNNVPLGQTSPTAIATMPPFCAINFVIKWQ